MAAALVDDCNGFLRLGVKGDEGMTPLPSPPQLLLRYPAHTCGAMLLASMRSLPLRYRAASSTRSLATVTASPCPSQHGRGAEPTQPCTAADGMLHVAWPDGRRSRLPLLWLRAFCPADAVSTGQRTRNIGDFYGNVAVASAHITGAARPR